MFSIMIFRNKCKYLHLLILFVCILTFCQWKISCIDMYVVIIYNNFYDWKWIDCELIFIHSYTGCYWHLFANLFSFISFLYTISFFSLSLLRGRESESDARAPVCVCVFVSFLSFVFCSRSLVPWPYNIFLQHRKIPKYSYGERRLSAIKILHNHVIWRLYTYREKDICLLNT